MLGEKQNVERQERGIPDTGVIICNFCFVVSRTVEHFEVVDL